MKKISLSLLIATVLVMIIVSTVQAHHYIYLGHHFVDLNNQNRTFDRWYATQMFHPDKDKLRIWNKDLPAANLSSAIGLWFGINGIGQNSFMDYEIKTGNLQQSQYDISIETDSTPCSGIYRVGCWVVLSYAHNSTGDSYQWYKSAIQVEPLSAFVNSGDYKAGIAHEFGHALGLHERYVDQGTYNCQHPTGTEHSIMEGQTTNGAGLLYKCDVESPSAKDIQRVKAIYGYEADTEAQVPSYPYSNIGPFNNALEVQYSFKDMRIADASVKLRYYYWNGPITGTPILAGEELLDADYNGYYSLGNGLTKPLQNRTLSQEWNPASWGVPWGKYVSVCARSWHSLSVSAPTQTCSSQAYYWAPGP